MEKFQNYLDKALKKIEFDNSMNNNNDAAVIEYDIADDISELVLTIRKEMGISQRQLSEKTGVPQANISKIENGHYLPSLSILKRLADGLGKRLVIDFIDIEAQMEDWDE